MHQENYGRLSIRLFSARNLDLPEHTADLVRSQAFGSFETCNSHQCHSRIFRSPILTKVQEICSKHQEVEKPSLQPGPIGASVTYGIGMRFTISPLRRLAYLKRGFLVIRKSTAAFNRDCA